MGNKIQSKKKNNNILVLLLDMMVSTIASIFAVLYLRWHEHPIVNFDTYLLLWALLALLASLVAFLISGTNRIVIRHSSYRSISKLIGATAIKELILTLLLLSGVFGQSYAPNWLMLIIADLSLTLLMLIITRVIIIEIYSRLASDYEKDVDRIGVMVYGTSDKSVSMVTRLEQSTHYNVLGFLTSDKLKDGQIRLDHKVYWFETEEDIARLKQILGIESVLFSKDSDAEEEKNRLIPMCLYQGIHILSSPRIEEVKFGGMSKRAIKDVVDNDFIPDGMSSFERDLKRAVDCFLAFLLIVLFSPLFLACYIAIKIGGGPGPVLYKQERIGRFGRPFKILKFRSMREDAESDGPQLYSGDDDPRLTKVGKFLRQHHLDELPQLWNVFVGQMAFIGWRPERKFYIDKIMEVDPRYYYLYQIRPGVTSYATLRNGYTDSMDKMIRRLEFDLYYLRHRSALFDMKILLLTFVNIVFGKKF